VEFGEELLTKDGNGDRVVEDEGLTVVELMRGATQSYTECGSRGRGVVHGFKRSRDLTKNR
jgi:hypothetical protein